MLLGNPSQLPDRRGLGARPHLRYKGALSAKFQTVRRTLKNFGFRGERGAKSRPDGPFGFIIRVLGNPSQMSGGRIRPDHPHLRRKGDYGEISDCSVFSEISGFAEKDDRNSARLDPIRRIRVIIEKNPITIKRNRLGI